jgi:phage FluMu gp28-like protein
LGSRLSSEKLPPVLQLRPYQQRWVDDGSRFKGAVKSARIGFSFGTGVEALLDSIERSDGGTTWTVGSASKAQSIEFVEMVQKNLQLIGAVGQLYEEPFADIEGISSITQSRIQIGNSRIIALPANPRTMRGYPGNAILDEYGHHEDSYGIWAAVASPGRARSQAARNLDSCWRTRKVFTSSRASLDWSMASPPANPVKKGAWSWHWVDLNLAIAEGCPINMAEMRDLFKDEELFSQEFLCVFLKAAGAWLPHWN